VARVDELRAALRARPAAAAELARLADDDRWRVREGVAMGLQRLGDADLPRLLALARLRAQAGLDPGASRPSAPR
jgi:hypothetical protein